MTAGTSPVRARAAWHAGRCATRSPPAPAGGFLWTALCGFCGPRYARPGALCDTRSPGWQPGDTGHEHHPAIHAGRRHAHLWFEPTPHGTREGGPPGVPRLPPGAFCGRRYAVFLWTALRGFFVDGVTRFFCGRRYAVFLWTALCGFFVDGVMRFFVGGVMRFFVDGVTRFFVGGVMPGLGLLVSPRSPGWQPGDTGHENHPAIHAG